MRGVGRVAFGLALLLPVPPAAAESLVSLPQLDYASPATVAQAAPNLDRVRALVYPTIGCPSIVTPGGDLVIHVLLDDGGQTTDWSASIHARLPVPQSHTLLVRAATYDQATKTYRLRFELPGDVPEDTFDLRLQSPGLVSRGSPGGVDEQPNAVRVLRDHDALVFAHIADSQIRDPTTIFPQKFEQLLYELSLRDPAFVIFSGDINFGADYLLEYEENWQIMRRRAVPLSCAPGNHDGYAWLHPQTAALDYDGLHMWRKTFGPTRYAFRVGGLRIVAANSFDGDAARRNSFTFLTVNAGGQLDPPQLAWVEQQAAEAGQLGDEMLLFCHHNPSKGITPNVVAYPWDIANVGKGSGVWNDPHSKAELLRIATDHPAFSWFFAGHTNRDEHDLVPVTSAGGVRHTIHYVNTTSPSNGGTPAEGYRLVTVAGGRIASVDRPGLAGATGSVPFPLGGNLFADFIDANDGTEAEVHVNVENRLPEDVPVTLEVALLADARGYRTSAGFIRDVAVGDQGEHIVYVRVTAPGGAVQPVTISPDPSGQGVQPGQTQAPPVTAQAPSTGGGGGGGGGGCALGAGDRPDAGLLALVALAALAWVRRKRA